MDIKYIERLLLDQWGFTDDGAVDAENQLKIDNILNELKACLKANHTATKEVSNEFLLRDFVSYLHKHMPNYTIDSIHDEEIEMYIKLNER